MKTMEKIKYLITPGSKIVSVSVNDKAPEDRQMRIVTYIRPRGRVERTIYIQETLNAEYCSHHEL